MTSLHLQRALFSLLGLLPLAHASAEGFIDDSKLKLQLRNVYFNENFRDEHGMSAKSARTAKSERTEWAQGFCWITSRDLRLALSGLVLMLSACSGSSSTPAGAAAALACCPCIMTVVRLTNSQVWV